MGCGAATLGTIGTPFLYLFAPLKRVAYYFDRKALVTVMEKLGVYLGENDRSARMMAPSPLAGEVTEERRLRETSFESG